MSSAPSGRIRALAAAARGERQQRQADDRGPPDPARTHDRTLTDTRDADVKVPGRTCAGSTTRAPRSDRSLPGKLLARRPGAFGPVVRWEVHQRGPQAEMV